MVDIDCPHGVAPGRMPRADCDGAGSKEIGSALPRSKSGAGGLIVSGPREDKSLHFFGEAPERRPWAIQREDAPGRFCPALPNGNFPSGYPFLPTQASILSRSSCYRPTSPITEFEKSIGGQRENFEGNQRGPLQLGVTAEAGFLKLLAD